MWSPYLGGTPKFNLYAVAHAISMVAPWASFPTTEHVLTPASTLGYRAFDGCHSKSFYKSLFYF